MSALLSTSDGLLLLDAARTPVGPRRKAAENRRARRARCRPTRWQHGFCARLPAPPRSWLCRMPAVSRILSGTPSMFRIFFDHIPGRARDIGDDGPVLFEQRVQKRRLAHVRLAHDRGCKSVSQYPACRKARLQQGDILGQGSDLTRQGLAGLRFRYLLPGNRCPLQLRQ